MSKFVDKASRLIRAPSSKIYRSLATSQAVESWLPPQGMTGTMLEFAFREGGAYRLRLTYNDAVTFESDDPAFAGEMRIYRDARIRAGRNPCDGTLRGCPGRNTAGGAPSRIGLDTRQSGRLR